MSFGDEREPDELEAQERPRPVLVELVGADAALTRALVVRFGLSPTAVVRCGLLALALPPLQPRRSP